VSETRLKDEVKIWKPLPTELKEKLGKHYQDFITKFLSDAGKQVPVPQLLEKGVRAIKAARAGDTQANKHKLSGAAEVYFFMPTELPRLWAPMAELVTVKPYLLQATQLRILELGVTTGGAAAAMISLAAHGFKGSIDLTTDDRLPGGSMENYLDAAAGATGLKVSWTLAGQRLTDIARIDLKPSARPHRLNRVENIDFDLILVNDQLWSMEPESHENAATLMNGLLTKLKPDGAMIITERAHEQASRFLSIMRDELLKTETSILAPCLAAGPCPKTMNPTGHCYHNAKVPLHIFQQQTGDLADTPRHEVKYSYLTLALTPESLAETVTKEHGAAEALARNISFASKGRMGYKFQSCHKDGFLNLHLPRWVEDQRGDAQRTKRLGHGTLVYLKD
jgi:Mitochondrial small ribosomal subunit Rsm22